MFCDQAKAFLSQKGVPRVRTCESGVSRTKLRDGVAGVDSALIDAKVLLCLRVVVQRNSRAGGERHQPDRVSGRDAQWAGPDPGLIVANVFEALSEMRRAADYGLRGLLLPVF
jgi:hypothetical protein